MSAFTEDCDRFEAQIGRSWETIAANAARAGVRVALAMNAGQDEFQCKQTVKFVEDPVVNTVTFAIMDAAIAEWKRLQ